MVEQNINNPTQHFNNPDHFEKMFIWLFDELAKKYPDKTLPSEIQREIFRLAGGDTTYVYAGKPPASAFTVESPKALLKFIPPPKGASPFMKLPTELRRQIFAESLPGHDVLLHPKCAADSAPASPKEGRNGGFFLNRKPRSNNVSNLMVINKKICEEVAEMMYEERTFVIHVHEGLVNGGVEFLTTGLQPLQYLNLDVLEDNRFDLKFGRNAFSFRRLKKIVVQIHPTTENEFRHTAVNTHFIVKALCSLLDRGDGDTEKKENRITRLDVEFVKAKGNPGITGRRAIMKEQYWWDPLLKQPRTTSIHDLSNIELVLRPFEMLACHSVHIMLPDNLYRHQPTVDVVSRLENTMTSTAIMGRYVDDDVERKIEVLRAEMEEYVTYTAHGKGFHSIENLTATDMHGEEDEDGGYDSAIDSGSVSDDEDSMDWVNSSGSRVKQTIGERRSHQKVILKSLESAQADEDALIASAIAASMEDFQSYQSVYAGQLPLGMSPSMDLRSPTASTTASCTHPGVASASQSKGSSPDDPIDVDDDDDDDVEMMDAANALSNLRRVYSDY